MDFKKFKQALQARFAEMSKYTLFKTNLHGDQLWNNYLLAFPAGSNPIYRERTEHDCSCCRQFIKNIGGVVAIKPDGTWMTIWNIAALPVDPAYLTVAGKMDTLVRRAEIEDIYLHYERSVGTDKNFEDMVDSVKTWEHFHVTLPAAVVVSKKDIGPKLNNARTAHDVLLRSLNEISLDSVDTVLELIAQNSLYRGEEHKSNLVKFRKVLVDGVAACHIEDYAWTQSQSLHPGISRLRNTSIGTLLVDLSEGMDLESAVKRFEAMVAPANYKRPTALVTKKQIEAAKAKLTELGLTPALERRYAHIDDISINNVLFADRAARRAMGGDVFDNLADAVKVDTRKFDKIEEVSVDKFIKDVLPHAKSIEALVENRHASNFMSLIAPVDPSAPLMFKWPNGFSWTYNGDMADSIKERVKQAGGNVTGELCCRLAWEYTDDLDFHMYEPNGDHIYFGNRSSYNGGMLDVDANGGNGMMAHPVENIFYKKISTMTDGMYRLVVNNFSRRSDGVGFEIEIDVKGELTHIIYDKVIGQCGNVEVANIEVRKGNVTVTPLLPSTTASKSMWGIQSQTFRRVTSILPSPNHWDSEGVGNKHYFFMLDGCKNDGKARGFYNEFLKAELNEHRKVLELVGAKMKTEADDNQLSGLGFSTTQRNDITLRVNGSITRTIKVVF